MTNKKEYILCAAIWYKDGIARVHQPRNISEGFVICGWRHHNCIMTAKIIRGTKPKDNKIASIQGFLTSKDRFLDRKESYLVAVAAGQIIDDSKEKQTLSKDLIVDKDLTIDWVNSNTQEPILISEDLY